MVGVRVGRGGTMGWISMTEPCHVFFCTHARTPARVCATPPHPLLRGTQPCSVPSGRTDYSYVGSLQHVQLWDVVLTEAAIFAGARDPLE